MSASIGGPPDDSGERVEAVTAAVSVGWPIRAMMLGVVTLLLGLALSWGQDVVAPWVNQGEADTGSDVSFDSDGGRYRVVSSGPARPGYDAIVCEVADADGGSRRILGGKDANANDRLGVSRVLEFTAPAGRTTVTCSNRFNPSNVHGRFQVVDANGPMSIAVWASFGLGTLLLVGGGLGLLVALRRSAR